MHGEEGEVHADEHEPEVPFAERFTQALSGELGPPVIDAGEESEHGAAEEDIVEVRDDEIGVLLLCIGRRRGVSDAAEPPDDK